MVTSQTEIESQVIELSQECFESFCDDISGMFGVDMRCRQGEACAESAEGLKRRFNKTTAVSCIKSEGALEGTFQLVFDQDGLFTLGGVAAMQSEQTIAANRKAGSVEKAKDMSGVLAEVGDTLAGCWDRVFGERLEGHKGLAQTNTFVGELRDKLEEKDGAGGDEEFLFVPCEITIGSHPRFNCGVVFPKAIFGEVSEPGSEQVGDEEETEKQSEEEMQDEKDTVEKSEAAEGDKVQEQDEGRTGAEGGDAEAVSEVETETKAEEQKPNEEETAAEGKVEETAAVDNEAAAETQAKEGDTADNRAEAEEDAEETAPVNKETVEVEKVNAAAEEGSEANKNSGTEESTAAVEEKSGDAADNKAGTAEENDSKEQVISETIRKMADSPAELPGEELPSATAAGALGICAKEIMQKEVVWGDGDDSVEAAFNKMEQHKARYMLIGRDGAAEGIVSRSDIKGAVSVYLRPVFAKWRRVQNDATLKIKVKWIMSKPVDTVEADTPLGAVMEWMCRSGRRCVAVTAENASSEKEGQTENKQRKVEGLITVFDVLRTLLGAKKEVTEQSEAETGEDRPKA